MAKPAEEQEQGIYSIKTDGKQLCGTRKTSFVPGTVKPTKVQPTPPKSQMYSCCNETQKKEGISAPWVRPQTHPGWHPASHSYQGAVERVRDTAHRGRFQPVSGHSSVNVPEPLFNPFTLLASTMTSGNEVYSSLTPP